MNPVLNVLFFLHFLNDGMRSAVIALLPFVAKEMHLSYTQVGILSASQGFMMVLLSLPSAFLATKFGGFKILFLALLFTSVGSLVIGVAPDLWMLMLAFYLGASGFGLFHTVCNSLIARISESKKTARNMGNSATFGDLGRISLPVTALFLAASIGWRGSFFVLAGVGLVTYVIVQWVLPLRKQLAEKTSRNKAISHKEWFAEIPSFLRDKKLLLVTCAGALDNIGASPIFIFLPFFILSKGFGIEMLGWFTALYFGGSIAGKSILAWGSGRFGTAKTFLFAEIGMAITLVIFTFLQHIALLFSLSFLLGLFARGTTPLVSTLFSEITHEDHYEKTFGIGETVFGLSIIFSPIFMGYLADTFGVVTVFYAAAVLGCLATIPIMILLKNKVIAQVHVAPAGETEATK